MLTSLGLINFHWLPSKPLPRPWAVMNNEGVPAPLGWHVDRVELERLEPERGFHEVHPLGEQVDQVVVHDKPDGCGKHEGGVLWKEGEGHLPKDSEFQKLNYEPTWKHHEIEEGRWRGPPKS